MREPPLSALELCEAVRRRCSFDSSRLDRVLGVDTMRGLVEVQANAPWSRLAERLRPDAFPNAAQMPSDTVADSIAANAAGPDGRPVVVHVESLTLVSPEGQLRRIDRAGHPGLFALTVGGQGVFGILYSATLRLQSLARVIEEAQPARAVVSGERKVGARMLRLLVPPASAEALIADVRARCNEWRVGIDGLELRGTRMEDETFLRWARRDYLEIAIALDCSPTLGAAVRLTQLIRELIDVAITHGGSFPIACTPEATRPQTDACYPQLPAFLAEQRRMDPGGRLVNRWLHHHRSLIGRECCQVRWNR